MYSDVFKGWERVINKDTLNSILVNLSPSLNKICPQQKDVFRAFTLCPLEECKVIFLGQDPYPQKGVATGILFGNSIDTSEEELSPSLKIIKEAAINPTITHNYPIEFDNTLESWAKQGILMINSALTCEVNRIGSHTMLWRPFISQLFETLGHYDGGKLYVLWGKQAQTFEPYINKKFNIVLKENHPAFYARTHSRMPSDIFRKIDEFMFGQYKENIEWFHEYNLENND